MIMDDLKFNTEEPFSSEHQIFHAVSGSNSYDREVREPAVEKLGILNKD